VVSAASAASDDQLDAAIRETSDYLNAHLTKGNKLVILNIQSAFPALSEYIIDELIANTVNDRVFAVVDRQQLDDIRAELDFQMSEEVNDKSAQRAARMSGAQIIISGGISKIGTLYRLRIRALGVENAQIQGQFNRNIPEGPTVTALLKSDATGYGGGSSAAPVRPAAPATVTATVAVTPAAAPAPVVVAPVVPPPAPVVPVAPPPAPPPAPTYKIGDKGPAGGIVFFDKGYSSDGWQYLEAASRDALTAHWGPRVSGTREGLVTGKQNTALIVRGNETGTAAHRCREYQQGGYSDWFLSSSDELNLMYQNLKQKGLGGFSGENYWSSSQFSSNLAYYQTFSKGERGYTYRSTTYSVRAVRQF
jgi:hypothetical protein